MTSASEYQLQIERLSEIDDDGEVLGHLSSWYSDGHHDPADFLRALFEEWVIDYAEAVRLDVDLVRHTYYVRDRRRDQSWTFREVDPDSWRGRRADLAPVTLYDLERRSGGPRCTVLDCGRVAQTTTPVLALVEPTESAAERMSVDLHLCREHRAMLPDPWYRVCLIPVGATVVLDAKGDQ